jgi:hypothetical protein
MGIFIFCCGVGVCFGAFRSNPETRCIRPSIKNPNSSTAKRIGSRNNKALKGFWSHEKP